MPHGRMVYCKNGDVAAELAALGEDPAPTSGGPSHYIGTVLRWTGDQPVLLLSFNSSAQSHRTRRAQAHTLARGRLLNTALAPLAKSRMFVATAARILAFKPNWILCAASGPPLWACYLVARLLGIGFVHTRHGRFGGDYRWMQRLETKVDGWVIRRAGAVICHGPYLHAQLRELGVPEEQLLEFNLSYRYLLEGESARPAPPPDSRTPSVLYVGRVQGTKGVFDLLEAMQPLLEADPALRLVYAGDGPDLPRLRALAEKSKQAGQVEIHGHVPHERVPHLIRDAHLVAAPTRDELGEARCKTAIEALVLGRPVVAPHGGWAPYLISHGVNGLLYKTNDVSDLTAQIGTALYDEDLYSRITQGAHASAAQLLDSSFTFEDALEAAYRLSVTPLVAARAP